jgi:hypothetical protein
MTVCETVAQEKMFDVNVRNGADFKNKLMGVMVYF